MPTWDWEGELENRILYSGAQPGVQLKAFLSPQVKGTEDIGGDQTICHGWSGKAPLRGLQLSENTSEVKEGAMQGSGGRAFCSRVNSDCKSHE